MNRQFLQRDARLAAPDLLGCLLVVPQDGIVVRIVEVEAYAGQDDPAAHSYRGVTPRTQAMFGPAGHAYVYFNYGMHWALNVVAGDHNGHGILIRAAEPLLGLDAIRARRHAGQKRPPGDHELLRGPGNLAKGLGVTADDYGTDLFDPASRLYLRAADNSTPLDIVASKRIGIRQAADELWRFSLRGSPFVSRPIPR